jgi:hypothetical protein
MKLYIKNMVCSRCKMVVEAQMKSKGLRPLSVNLGEVEIEGDLSKEQLSRIPPAKYILFRKIGINNFVL